MPQYLQPHLEVGEFNLRRLRTVVDDGEGQRMTSFGRFADAVVDFVEGLPGVNKATGSQIGAQNDTTVFAMVNAIAGFEHGTLARHGAVVADARQFGTFGAGCYHVLTKSQNRHLAGILMALNDTNLVGSGGYCCDSVLCCVAHVMTIDGQTAVNRLEGFSLTGNNDMHIDWMCNVG